MKNLNLNTIRRGDLIVREKGPLSEHYIVSMGWQNGIQIVAENHNGEGVRYTSLEAALDGKPIKRFEQFGGAEKQRSLVKSTIDQMLGKSYDLINFNCEHFARTVSNGKTESKQIKTTANLLLLSGLYLTTKRNHTLRNIGIALLVIGGLIRITQ